MTEITYNHPEGIKGAELLHQLYFYPECIDVKLETVSVEFKNIYTIIIILLILL